MKLIPSRYAELLRLLGDRAGCKEYLGNSIAAGKRVGMFVYMCRNIFFSIEECISIFPLFFVNIKTLQVSVEHILF